MNSYDDLLEAWGRDLMKSHGYDVPDHASVYVDFESTWSGGCETCSWEEKKIVVRYGSSSVKYDVYSLEELLKEVLAYGNKAETVNVED